MQVNELETAKQDFTRVLRIEPNHEHAKTAMKWLMDPTKPRPSMFTAPKEQIRPTRPNVISDPVEVVANDQFNNIPPYDTWVLRTEDKKEFGPVYKKTLDLWISQGRAAIGMKLLRADWKIWIRI